MNRRDFAKSALVSAGLGSVAVAEIEKPKFQYDYKHIEVIDDCTIKAVGFGYITDMLKEAAIFVLLSDKPEIRFTGISDDYETVLTKFDLIERVSSINYQTHMQSLGKRLRKGM